MVGNARAVPVGLDLVCAESAGPRAVRRRRDRRLADLVRYVRVASPYYARCYRRLPDVPHLVDLPPVAKPDLMEHFDAWVTDPSVRRADLAGFVGDPDRVGHLFADRYLVWTSSGTSGQPGLFLQDEMAVALYRALTVARLDRRWLRARDWPAMARHRLRWASVIGTGDHYAGAAWIEAERRRSAWRRHAFRVFPVQGPPRRLTAALDDFDPAILTSYPSGLDLLAREQREGRLHLRPVAVESAGETLTPPVRQRIEGAFGRPVHEAYSASECLSMAFSCSEGWLHVNADWVILEPVDADGRATPAGEASHSVLLTNLANRVQPLVRYDLGDSVRVRPDRCPCGSTLPALRVSGRCDDVLLLPGRDSGQVEVLPLAIGCVVEQTPGVAGWQLLRAGPRALRVRLLEVPGADRADVWRALRSALRAYLAQLGVADDVDLVLASEPPERVARSGKLHQVVA